ncbi:FAD-dependent oxidoreductase [Paenibacillus sp.]|uniref:FAD-dependent oxidoreductase n=1 Tax=Paenibacillus sp. TaxID=58172 RepID=UPI002D4CABAD|nr:FAD-dependent oxidoreductase [Paenibacillus sp.]HZG56420.1 FAD-dependent oxidoreductase [Paenibacillus sp.]
MVRKWIRAAAAFALSGVVAASAFVGGGTAAAGTLSQHAEWFSGKAVGPVPLEVPAQLAGLRTEYDVIVAGTDPEGVAAAVSAARNGLTVLLVDGRNRTVLGGLMTLGWLNSLDLNRYSPDGSILNKGIFTEWYKLVEGDSFDVTTAANAFRRLVDAEKNIDVLMPVRAMEPVVETFGKTKTVVGMDVTTKDGLELFIRAGAVIDATQDGDVFAAAGVPFTFGREDIGHPEARMAVTLVYRLNGVTPTVWSGIRERLKGKKGYGTTTMSAWGYSEFYQYKPSQPQVKMRGLNIGRQNDNTALVNALLLFGVDPLDPASVRAGIEAGEKELPLIIDYMRKHFPELSSLSLGGVAPEPYVRESRHMIGEYRLNVIDLLENKDKWDRIAFGSYPIDLQPTSPSDSGNILFKPIKYAVPFRSIVPKEVDGLLVVGRAASFDTLPHGSARTIPVGMATGQAAGAAVKVAKERGLTFRAMSKDAAAIATLQARLNAQGMSLQPYTLALQPYEKHRHYSGLKTVLSFGLTSGKYDNDFRLDAKANPVEYGLLYAGSRGYFGDKLPTHPSLWYPADKTLEAQLRAAPLTLDNAALIAATALGLEFPPNGALDALKAGRYVQDVTLSGIRDPKALTVGESYMVFRDVAMALGFRPAASSVR